MAAAFSPKAMVVTDLDGTLLNSRRQIGPESRAALERLGAEGICRVVATGRSLHSVRHVLAVSDPLDYVIFSSGTGAMDWSTQRLVQSTGLTAEATAAAVAAMLEENVNFAVHDPVPENHCFAYHEACVEATDFRRRNEICREFLRPLANGIAFPHGASQLLAVIPPDLERLERLRCRFRAYSVVRTTSPLDHTSIWVEIFAPGVHKGSAADALRQWLGVPPERTHALGNDYNDLDLLAWAAHAAVVGNAPEDLRSLHPTVGTHDEDGFAQAVSNWRRNGWGSPAARG